MADATYHITRDRATGRPVLFCRHALPPHDVVERIEFPDTAKMREVGEALIDLSSAYDVVDALNADAPPTDGDDGNYVEETKAMGFLMREDAEKIGDATRRATLEYILAQSSAAEKLTVAEATAIAKAAGDAASTVAHAHEFDVYHINPPD